MSRTLRGLVAVLLAAGLAASLMVWCPCVPESAAGEDAHGCCESQGPGLSAASGGCCAADADGTEATSVAATSATPVPVPGAAARPTPGPASRVPRWLPAPAAHTVLRI